MPLRPTLALGVVALILGPALAQVPVGVPSGPPLSPQAIATGPHAPVTGYPGYGAPVPVMNTPMMGTPMMGGPVEAITIGPACTVWGSPTTNSPFYVTGEFLLAFLSGNRLAPIFTSSPVGTPRDRAAVLAPTTTITNILFSGVFNEDPHAGVRAGVGYLIDPEWGITGEVGGSVLESKSTHFVTNSAVNPILGRPYLSTVTRNNEAVLIGFPGVSEGRVDARINSGNLYQIYVDLNANLLDDPRFRLDGTCGYRYIRYDEGLLIRQVVNPSVGQPFPTGTEIASYDAFTTHNTFNGIHLGGKAHFLLHDDFGVCLHAKFLVGNLGREVKINGGQKTTVPGQLPITRQGGVLALESNIGTYSSDDIVVMPEFGVGVNYQLNPNVRLTFGYSVLFLEGFARAADQINLTLNPNIFPPAISDVTPRSPAFTGQTRDILVQTLQLGLNFTF